jgi:hypothetical protein
MQHQTVKMQEENLGDIPHVLDMNTGVIISYKLQGSFHILSKITRNNLPRILCHVIGDRTVAQILPFHLLLDLRSRYTTILGTNESTVVLISVNYMHVFTGKKLLQRKHIMKIRHACLHLITF